jgi:hypothetical protein
MKILTYINQVCRLTYFVLGVMILIFFLSGNIALAEGETSATNCVISSNNDTCTLNYENGSTVSDNPTNFVVEGVEQGKTIHFQVIPPGNTTAYLTVSNCKIGDNEINCPDRFLNSFSNDDGFSKTLTIKYAFVESDKSDETTFDYRFNYKIEPKTTENAPKYFEICISITKNSQFDITGVDDKILKLIQNTSKTFDLTFKNVWDINANDTPTVRVTFGDQDAFNINSVYRERESVSLDDSVFTNEEASLKTAGAFVRYSFNVTPLKAVDSTTITASVLLGGEEVVESSQLVSIVEPTTEEEPTEPTEPSDPDTSTDDKPSPGSETEIPEIEILESDEVTPLDPSKYNQPIQRAYRLPFPLPRPIREGIELFLKKLIIPFRVTTGG